MIQHQDKRFLSPEVLLAFHHYLNAKDVFEWPGQYAHKPGKEEWKLTKEMLKFGAKLCIQTSPTHTLLLPVSQTALIMTWKRTISAPLQLII